MLDVNKDWHWQGCTSIPDRMRQNAVTLAGGELNRAAHLRRKSAVLRDQSDSVVVPIWRGRVPMGADGRLAIVASDAFAANPEQDLFLGLLPHGCPVFAHDASALNMVNPEQDISSPWNSDGVCCEGLGGILFHDLRAVMTHLTLMEAELAGTARGMFEWHRKHGYCAACGVKSKMSLAGWQRDCPACGAAHYPRTDPVVIMLVTRGNSVLLGRNAMWPERMYSLLAGFVEPGEPIEAAVRREVFEEAGVRVGAVDYVASQPWPFPASLMVGCRAEALSTEIIIDPEEIEDARWVTREDVALAMAGRHPEIAPMRKGAIAQFLLAKWLADSWE